MNYYFTTTIENSDLETVLEKVTASLKEEGFGVVTDFNLTNAFKTKLDYDYRPYRILGACNPPFAKKILELDDKIGTLLPCNVILQQKGNDTEVSAINPVSAMSAVGNSEIVKIAEEVSEKLQRVISSLK